MYKDVPSGWDAWDIESIHTATPVELDGGASVEVAAAGPLVGIVRVKRRIHESSLVQEIVLRRGSRRIDFRTAVDWQEHHKLLKVNFPLTIHANEALHEIQMGHIARPNHRSRPFDADRFEVCNHKWTALCEAGRGAAVLNDCKYGANVDGGSINLTLLKSALAPDMLADRGPQEFTYALYVWNGPLFESGVVREAYDLNCPAVVAEGSAGGSRSVLRLDAASVVLETVKPAEDGRGDIVLRLYEAYRSATKCRLETPLRVAQAWQTDMLENKQVELALDGDGIVLDFRPFEIKTVRLRLG
jgi:alpha-mannosidase